MSTDPLRDAYAAHVRATTPADRTSCPSAEALEALVIGDKRTGSDRDTAAIEHVLDCAHCRRDFELLHVAHVAGMATSQSNKNSNLMTTTFAASNRGRIFAAASVLLAVVAGGTVWQRLQTNDSLPVFRGDVSGVQLVSPISTSGNPLEGPKVRRFTWHDVVGAGAYSLEVLDTTGAVLVTHVGSDTTFSLSDEEYRRVVAAKTFDWMVAATRGDGNERRSAVTRVRISP